MKLCASPLAALLLSAAFLPVATSEATNPISKVLQLISDLEARILKEGEEAQKVFEEFSEWCEDRSKNVGFEIKTGESEVLELKAAIGSAEADISAANAKIEELGGSTATDEADLKAATAIRDKEAKDYAAAEKEMVETISIIERAVGILEREMRKGGAAMLQLKHDADFAHALSVLVDASLLASQDAQRLAAFVQAQSDDDGFGAPDPAAYGGHSGSIIDTLESLLDKAREQLEVARSQETSSRHNFELLEQSLKDELKFAEKELSDTKQALASTNDARATAEGELQVTSKGLQEDMATKGSLHQECMQKSQDFEAATRSRGEELKALREAKKAIAESTAGAEPIAYGLGQVSLFEVGHANAMHSAVDLANFEAVQLIRNLARKTHSSALALLARRVSAAMREGVAAGQDPFAKVKALIRDMVEKLLAEGGSEASHKAYCDKEMGETAEKLADKTATIDKLTTEVDAKTAKSRQLKADVSALQKALSELTSSQAAMDKIRMEERGSYQHDKAETEQGLEGVKLALNILREYYAKEGAAHDTAEGAASGIIGLLEVVESDLTKGLAEMTIEEQTSQDEYERQTRENAVSKATKEQSVKYKSKESQSLDGAIADTTSDLDSSHAELQAVQEYEAKIKEMCIAKPDTYEERTRRREAEIAGLKEALQVLQGESVLLQGHAVLRGARRHQGA